MNLRDRDVAKAYRMWASLRDVLHTLVSYSIVSYWLNLVFKHHLFAHPNSLFMTYYMFFYDLSYFIKLLIILWYYPYCDLVPHYSDLLSDYEFHVHVLFRLTIALS